MKQVNKLEVAKFEVLIPDIPDSTLILDFNPLISEFKLEGDFYLIHWQARPKGHREFGVYNSKTDSYTCIAKLPKFGYGGINLLQLDDTQDNKLPSAVIYFKGVFPL